MTSERVGSPTLHSFSTPAVDRAPPSPDRPWLVGVLFGIGFGGFVDGIVLHQLLQWHHLLSASSDHPMTDLDGLEANTLADGVFHAVTLIVLVVAAVLLVQRWRAGRPAPPWPWWVGALLIGWGAFNLVEGAVNHHLLELHHVRDDVSDPTGWDMAFMVGSVVLVAIGALLTRVGDASVTGRLTERDDTALEQFRL